MSRFDALLEKLPAPLRKLLTERLMQSAGAFFVANVIERVIPFLLLPVLTRYLTPADYGRVAMFTVVFGVIQPFIHLNVHGAVTRSYYRREEIDFPAYVGNALALLVAACVGVTMILVPASGWIGEALSLPAEWLYLLPPAVFGSSLGAIMLALWQVQSKPKPYGLFSILRTLTEGALSLLLVVGLLWGWQGRVLGFVATYITFGLVALWRLRAGGWLRLGVDREFSRHALAFGLPLIPHALGNWALTALDRVFLTHMTSVKETGLFAVGASLASAIAMLTLAFNRAWTPWLYERLDEGSQQTRELIVDITYGYTMVLFVIAVGLGVAAPWVLWLLVGEQFYDAAQFMLWLCLGQAFHGFYLMAVGYLFFSERTRPVAVATVLSVLVNTVANYILILSVGGVGAALATMLAHMAHFVFTMIAAQRVYPMPWNPLASLKRILARLRRR